MQSNNTKSWHRVLILGGGISGLITAKVVSRYFNEVIIIEKDKIDDINNEPRRSIPQGNHIHFLLTAGINALDSFFPNLFDQLEAAGANRYNITESLKWYHHGNWKKLFESNQDLVSYAQTRPMLEYYIRKEVLQQKDIRLIDGCKITRFLYDEIENSINGVAYQSKDNNIQEIKADLIIDAMGRSSKLIPWFTDLEIETPEVETIDVDIKYTSTFYPNPNGELNDYTIQAVYPNPPNSSKFGAIADVEGDKVLVTLMGIAGDHPTSTEEGFLEFAKQLDKPYVYDKIKDSEPLTDIKSYRYPRMRRLHMEKLNSPPHNFLAIGDAICHFDPLFAQGMSVAALEVQILDELLENTSNNQLANLNRDYFDQINEFVSNVWDIVVMEDTRYNITHKPNLKQRLFQKYTNHIHKLYDDEFVVERFYQVLNLEKSPYYLMHPKILFKIVKRNIVNLFTS